jgi:cytochrome b561
MKYRSSARYGSVAQVFHWLTAIVVLVAFIFGPGGSEQHVYSSARDFDRQLHETLGLCVFALAILRVLWRAFDTHPAPPPASRWMLLASKAVQFGLYLLMFLLPLTAICGAWLEGHALTLLASVQIPSPVGTAHDTGAVIAEIHTWLGDAILWLAGLHACAALYHHFIVKDGVLVSMLPDWFR